jgi:cytochrome c
MGGPAPQPFNKALLLLVFAGLSAVVIGAWLVLRAPAGPSEPVNLASPDDEPAVVAPPVAQAPDQPVEVALASADAARGERFFRGRCAVCHTIGPGGPHGIGPNLHGAMGDRIAARPGYDASDALRQAGGRWDWQTADRFLRSPRGFAPGTRMAFAGINDAQERADVLFYLNGQGGRLPAPAGSR